MIFQKKGTKPKKTPKMKKPFSSRTLVGVVCIILALAVTFGVAPLVNRFTEQKVDIIRLKADVKRGQIIEADDLEHVKVGSYNLPSEVIKDSKEIIGKYARTDLYAGDYLFQAKLSDESKSAEDVLLGLHGEKVAVSVAITSFENGLSSKLENGDIVSIIVYDKDNETSYIPDELRYVKVITVTTGEGVDKDKAEEGMQFETVTLLVTPEQAERLAYYNSTTDIHFTLVYRGESEQANAYITMQDEYLEAHPMDNQPKTEAEGDING